MSNLYVKYDLSGGRATYFERTRESLDRLQRTAGYFADADGDLTELLLDELFADGLPAQFYVSNLSMDGDYVLLALRPVLSAGRRWPFPDGRSLCVKGGFPAHHLRPIFNIVNVQEVADGPQLPFERLLDVTTWRDTPENRRLNHHAPTPEFVAELPSVARHTSQRLFDWTQFLKWREKLVRERSTGLRYVSRKCLADGLILLVVAENDKELERSLRLLRRGAKAFELKVSEDEWSFRLPKEASGQREGGLELGQMRAKAGLQGQIPLDDCPWNRPVLRELRMDWSDDDRDWLARAEEPQKVLTALEDRVPEQGFLATSIAGELSLIQRHRDAVQRVRDQGGFSPYLSAWLFDVTQANLPDGEPAEIDWHRKDLNEYQRLAVAKILAAPDLALIQGPPGTGKTTVIAEATYQLARHGKKVLLASQAHLAVDNVLERLTDAPEIRAIRLGPEDKLSEVGKEFSEANVLDKFYSSIAKACRAQYLQAWQERDARIAAAEQWLERGRLAAADLATQRAEVARLCGESRDSQVEYDAAVAQVQLQREANLRARERHDALMAQVHALREGKELDAIEILEPSASALAGELFALADNGLDVAESADVWQQSPANRDRLLPNLIRAARALFGKLPQLRRDWTALAQGSVDVGVAAQHLERIQAELEQVERAMQADDGDQHLPRWRSLKAERDKLKQASGPDARLYRSIFRDGAVLAERCRSDPRLGSVELEGRIADLVDRERAFQVRLAHLVAALIAEADRQVELPLSDEPVIAAERRVAESARRLAKAQQSLEQREHSAKTALVASGRASPTLAEAVADVAAELAVLRDQAAADFVERHVWEPELLGWVKLLNDPELRKADRDQFIRTYIAQCNVVAISCNEKSKTLENCGQTYFDVVIIDEVSKATPPELLLPILRARKVILVGDHRQLPPLFREGQEDIDWQQAADDADDPATELTRENLHRYEKMVTASLFKEHFERAPEALRQRLEVQFRMHPQIMRVVNHFYEGRLSCGLADPDRQRAHGLTIAGQGGSEMLTPNRHVVWIDSSLDPAGQPAIEEKSDWEPRTNPLEAKLIAEFLFRLDTECQHAGHGDKLPRRKVGVVSFYAPQLRVIRDAIIARTGKQGRDQFAALDVEINTVQKYQGKEKPIVLVSLVRSFEHRVSQRSNVAQFQHVNVAFSRAEQLLVVFGATELFERIPVRLPSMDGAGHEERPVYRQIINQLRRDACLWPSSWLLAAEANPERRQRKS